MSRLAFLLIPAFALASCTGREKSDVPEQTVLVGDSGGYPLTPVRSPDGKRLAWSQPIAGQARIHVGAADGSNPVRLTHGTWDIDPIWSPDGSMIAFFGESPAFDLWVVGADGGAPRQLTSGPAVDQPLGWLPDGSGIVFARSNDGETRTMVAPVDGGPLRPLVEHRGGNQYAVPSPNGKYVSLEISRAGESTIWVQDAASGAIRQLTTEGFEAANSSRDTWSPDSRFLVFTSRRTGTGDLWTANVETGELKQLTSDIRDDLGHVWSPDGRWIAFVSDRGGQWDVWIVSSQGGDAIRVTNDFARESSVRWTGDGASLYFSRSDVDGQIGITVPGAEPRTLVNWPGYEVDLSQASLTPDERTLLFVGTRSGNNDIWSVPVAGGEATPFITGPLEERNPRYAPDGASVAFVSNRTGSWDLWVTPATGGDARRLTDWPSNEGSPQWSPDGSTIAFLSDRDATASDLWVVPALGGTPRRLTRFNLPIDSRPQWSPDGKSLYITLGSETGARLYRVPVSGGRPQELRIRSTPGPARGGTLSPDGAWYAYSAVDGGFAHLEITPTSGGAPRRLKPTTEPVWNTRPVWSRDGTKIATGDWRFDDDATEDVIEFTVADGTTRRLTSRPKAYDSPLTYTTDGRVLFASVGQNASIVQVSVARLLAPK